MNLLILGASARAAAHSARRAGWLTSCADWFADRDLTHVSAATRLPPSFHPGAWEAFARDAPPGPWVYTGGVENAPELIDRISASRPLWGNPAGVVREVRDPFRLADTLKAAGLPVPDVRRTPDGLPADGSWLVKPIQSAGGRGVRPWLDRLPRECVGSAVRTASSPNTVRTADPTLGDGLPDEPVYFQRRIRGRSFAALFLGVSGSATLLGVTRQYVGYPGSPFGYRGSLGPCSMTEPTDRRIKAIGRTLVGTFGLRGLFGVDFILSRGEPFPVEVNPRYTASVEVLELALRRPLLSDHARAFGRDRTERLDGHNAVAPRRVVGKAILFAEIGCTFPECVVPDLVTLLPLFEVPEVADVPHPGTHFEPGEPVLTVLATAPATAACRAKLRRRIVRWSKWLRPRE